MIKPGSLHQAIQEREFVPQAILAEEIYSLAERIHSKVEKGKDSLDFYMGTAGWLDGLLFTVMHYRGHPPSTSTIYLPFEIHDVNEITKILSRLIAEFGLPKKKIIWQRKDDLKQHK